MPDPFADLASLPGVADAAATAVAAVDRLRRHPALRRQGPQVAAEAALRGARASAALAGVDVPLGDLRDGALPSGEGGAVVTGALRTMTEAGASVDAWSRAPVQVLAALHVAAAAGLVPDELLGRPRPNALPAPGSGLAAVPSTGALPGSDAAAAIGGVPVVPVGPGGALVPVVPVGPGGALVPGVPAGPLPVVPGAPSTMPAVQVVEDLPGLPAAPPAGEVPGRLDVLLGLLGAPTDAPSVVVAGVVHGELLVLRPFAAANGVVARAAARLVLVARGVDPGAVSVPDAGLLVAGRDRYAEAAAAFATGTPDGVAQWLRLWADAVAAGADEGLDAAELVASRS